MFETALRLILDQGGLLAAIVIAGGWIIWKIFVWFDQREQKLQQQIYDLQVAISENNRDAYEQSLRQTNEYTDRLLALVTSDAESREKIINTLDKLTESIRAFQVDLDENDRRKDFRDNAKNRDR